MMSLEGEERYEKLNEETCCPIEKEKVLTFDKLDDLGII